LAAPLAFYTMFNFGSPRPVCHVCNNALFCFQIMRS
jgi:hypothetical protein